MSTDIFKEAKRLHGLGWAILWLHPKSKRPVGNEWTTGPRKTWEQLVNSYKEGMNLGVRTGTPSKIGKYYLACIDVDVKNPSFVPKAKKLIHKLTDGAACAMVVSGSGNGSHHLYCLTEKPFKMLTIYKGEEGEICVYSDGRQMALAPSIHPSGKKYKWGLNAKVEKLPVLKFGLPKENEHGTENNAASVSRNESQKVPTKGLQNFSVEPVPLSWLPISDTIRDGIQMGNNIVDRSAFLLKAATALLSAGLSQNEVLTVLTDPTTYLGRASYEHAQTKDRTRAAAWVYRYTLAKLESERSPQNIFCSAIDDRNPVSAKLSPNEVKTQSEEIAADLNWRQELDKSKEGKAKITLRNVDIILSENVHKEIFKKDLFANRVAYGAKTPWGGKAKNYIEDIDMLLVKRWLADTEFSMEPSTKMIEEATALIAHRSSSHPVREWLNSLKWDGKKRISTWLKDCCQGRAEEPYLSEVSKKFLLAMVKRVFEPGCQWDYVLVLEGKQGKYKSSIARAIASDKWFMDNLPDLKDKDAMLNLQGKWLIELAELTNVKRSDHNQVKAYLIRRTDTVRPHYGRIMADVPRQSVFIGTVNEGQYLKDPTGNRRFWPVKVGDCDVELLNEIRDQLFAEAVHYYKTENETLKLSPKADEQATEAQDDRRIDDDETEMRDLLERFMKSPQGEDFDFSAFRMSQLFEGPSAPWGKWDGKPYSKQNGGTVLRNLGFERGKSEGVRLWRPNLETGSDRGHTPFAMPPSFRGQRGHTGGIVN